MAQVTQILLFSGMLLLERSRITVSERHLLNKKFCYGSFEFVSNFCKKVFWGAPVKWVFLYGSSNSDSVIFGNDAFGEIKDHSLRATPFQKNVCYGSFEFVSASRKKVFSGAPVNCVFFCGSNNSDSVIVTNATFGELKDHSLSRIKILKIF